MDTDRHTELGLLWLSVFCSIHGESVLEYITEVIALEVIPWQMDGQTNEHHRYLNKKLTSELHGEVDSI